MVASVLNAPDSRTPTGQGYDGVVRVSVGSYYGTGVLLSGGYAILTAAHLFSNGGTAASVQFETVAGKETLTSSQVSVFPAYDVANENHDFALVWLTGTAPVAAE